MPLPRIRTLFIALAMAAFAAEVLAQKGTLKGVQKIKLEDTVVVNAGDVKEDFAPELVKSSLRNALGTSGFQVGDEGTVSAHIQLREFSSGNQAMRILVGFGSGRASIAADLIIKDAQGKQLVKKAVSAKGNLAWNAYQGSTTQRTQAFSAFEMRLLEEISRLK